MLELQHDLGGVAAHVLDGVLIAEPIGALDRVIHMPLPGVVGHVGQGRSNPSLRCDGMAARRKHFRDARGLEATCCHSHGCAQAGATGTDNDDVICVIDGGIGLGHGVCDSKSSAPLLASAIDYKALRTLRNCINSSSAVISSWNTSGVTRWAGRRRSATAPPMTMALRSI